MATTSNPKQNEEELSVNTTGEPTEQFVSENDDFDETPLADDEDRNGDEPYEGIRHEDDEDDLVDDNMTGMPVVPSPS